MADWVKTIECGVRSAECGIVPKPNKKGTERRNIYHRWTRMDTDGRGQSVGKKMKKHQKPKTKHQWQISNFKIQTSNTRSTNYTNLHEFEKSLNEKATDLRGGNRETQRVGLRIGGTQRRRMSALFGGTADPCQNRRFFVFFVSFCESSFPDRFCVVARDRLFWDVVSNP